MSKKKVIDTLKEVVKKKEEAVVSPSKKERKHVPLRDRKGNIIKKREHR
jgi:hypothetical protein